MFTIRQIGPEDLAIYKLIRASALKNNPDAFGQTLENFLMRDDKTHLAGLTKTAADPHSATFVAFDDETPIGMAGLVRQEGPKMRHKAFLWGMFIEPSHRGRGIGSMLVEKIIDAAKESGAIIQVHLTVVSNNIEAIRLYEKFGFQIWGTEPRALKSLNGYSDEIHMVLKIL
ncbi:MAG: GNAT family N-acetyltransferase [Proteobacteria bacterium]|nr:GNAT family N-acetyltransferase [Pseudomonadota bacterium]